MALRPLGVPPPPSTGNPSLDAWARQIQQAVNGLPFSYFSTSDGPNTSGITAPKGTLGMEIGSSITPLWHKADDSSLTTGWHSIATTP